MRLSPRIAVLLLAALLLAPAPLALPPRQSDQGYERPPLETQRFVPEVF